MLRRVANHRIDLTLRTEGGLPDPSLVLINPSGDLAWGKQCEAIQATTLRSSLDRRPMVDAAEGIYHDLERSSPTTDSV